MTTATDLTTTDTTTLEDSMTTATKNVIEIIDAAVAAGDARITALTVIEAYDKPRKCNGCERKRKVSLVEVAYAGTEENTVFTMQACSECHNAINANVGVGQTSATSDRMEREITEILRQQEEAERDNAYIQTCNLEDDIDRALTPLTSIINGETPHAEDPDTWACGCGCVNPLELQPGNPVDYCLDCEKPRPVICIERYGMVGEADAIYPAAPADEQPDVDAETEPAIGPEPGEILPKIFTDEIRRRIAAQKDAGATVPALAGAWGRTPASINAAIKKVSNG